MASTLSTLSRTLLLGYLFIGYVRNEVYDISQVSGLSMHPTLQHSELVLLNKMEIFDPKPNDIISIKFLSLIFYCLDYFLQFLKEIHKIQEQWLLNESKELRDKLLHQKMESKFLFQKDLVLQFKIFVPSSNFSLVFVEGDNLKASVDSNTYGCIPIGCTTGKVTHVVYPESFTWKKI